MTYFKVLFLVGSLLFFISCKDDKSVSSNSITKDSFLIVTIDGATTSFNEKVSVNSSPELSHVVNGYNTADKTRITLGLNLDTEETGTFDLQNDIVLVYHSHINYMEKRIKYLWHAKKAVTGATGTITITKNTAAFIEGEFSFVGIGGTKIDRSVQKFTNGSFRVRK